MKKTDQQDLLAPLPAPSPTPLPFVPYDLPQGSWNGLVIVGEAPGAEEVKQGHPFVGRSGKLLDALLEKTGLDRRQCLVANVFRFQPPGNKVDHFFLSKRAAAQQKVGIAEAAGRFGSLWCRDDFYSEIKELYDLLHQKRPKAILALGRTPLWALTGQNELLKKVGNFLPYKELPQIQVMPTYHPSFILRGNWGLQPLWEQHFLAAKQQLQAK